MNDNEKGSMDEIELDLTPMPTESSQRTLPQNEPLVLDPFAQATEDSLSGIPDDEPADDMWEDFFKPNPHVTMAQSPIKRVTLPENMSAFHAMKVGIAEANELLKQGGLENITEEQAKKLSLKRSVWSTSFVTSRRSGKSIITTTLSNPVIGSRPYSTTKLTSVFAA